MHRLDAGLLRQLIPFLRISSKTSEDRFTETSPDKRCDGLAYLFVAHDLAVVKHMSDRIAIMYLGQIMEMGGADEVYERPRHPDPRALIAAIPEPDPSRRRQPRFVLEGDVPSPIDPPPGCVFHTRCPHAESRCRQEKPALRELIARDGATHQIACHFDL